MYRSMTLRNGPTISYLLDNSGKCLSINNNQEILLLLNDNDIYFILYAILLFLVIYNKLLR